MRLALKELIDPGTVCRAFESEYGELTWFDLELLAAVEIELSAQSTGITTEGNPDGEGC